MSLVCVVTIKWCNSVVVCTLCICRVFVFHVFCIMTEHSSGVSDLCNSCISWISVAASIHDKTTCTFIKLSFYDWKVLGFLISSFTCIKVIGKWVYFISSLLCKVQSFFVHGLGSCLYKVITEGACVLIKGMIYHFSVIDWDTI